jgi:hypothetical protein
MRYAAALKLNLHHHATALMLADRNGARKALNGLCGNLSMAIRRIWFGLKPTGRTSVSAHIQFRSTNA